VTGKRGKPFPARRYDGAENCHPLQNTARPGRVALLRNAELLVRSTVDPFLPCLVSGYAQLARLETGNQDAVAFRNAQCPRS